MNTASPRAGGDGNARTTIPTSADPAGSRALRYVADIIELHERLSYRQLPAEISGTPLYHAEDEHSGLITLTARDSQFPARYLRGILGFRLAQYLRLSWISADLVYRTAAYHEPLPRPGPVESIHTVTLCSRTGRIRGYVGLSCSADTVSLPLDSPRRSLFPTEAAHGIDLLGQYARLGLGTHQVFELKRFLRDQSMPLGIQHDRVPWHLMLGMGEAMIQLDDGIRLVLGDAKEHVALRHLRLAGFDLHVVEDTSPSLPPSDPLAPIYHQGVLAKPFVAPVPEDLPWYRDVVSSYMDGSSDLTSYHEMVARLAGRRQASGGSAIPRQRGGAA
ncbi:hypothetical protein [Streptomyces pratensis]|uniref:hypothetical protein n=1 Tax=Streptomyces pratensis TaxID=1169025 RepID=UPI0019323F95|nr:hypothetical protein [Streptomyces pratensis]